MGKVPYTMPLSENAIGLPLLETELIEKNGLFEKCTIQSFTANYFGIYSTVTISYKKQYFDNKGALVDVEVKTKSATVKDLPETGLVDYDEKGNPLMETYVKQKDENLELTRWFQLLGGQINPALTFFINQTEGYPQQTPV
jgi:hypothetical protein